MAIMRSKVWIRRSALAISLLMILSFGFWACETSTAQARKQYTAIQQYFRDRQKAELPSSGQLFVISERGCMTCNKQMAKLVEQRVQKPSNLFLITASGSHVDISLFDNPAFTNVFFDQNIHNTEYTFFSQSQVIYFSDSRVDTMFAISAIELEQQFAYIEAH